MAIKPKGKKVTGTKKKDKITWTNSKPWKTNLTVKAGAGNDVINFSKSSSKYKHKIYGEAGKDVIKGGKGKDIIDGGAGNDKIYGNAGNDVLKAGKGNDYIDGGAGNDKIYGQYGTNKLKGGSGNDIIKGGTGTDKIYGTSGSNKLYGGKGNDFIYGGTGNDNIWGGAGNDYIKAGKGNNTIYLSKNEGTDTIVNGGGTDTLVFSAATDFRELNFEYSGNDLKISANGTTALLKDYKNGGHSVKYIKAGDKTLQLPQNVIVTNQPEYLYEREDNLFVFAHESGTGIYTGSGNDTVFASQDGITSVQTGSGDDVIIGSDYPYTEGGHLYYGNAGNDTVYVGKAGANVIVQQGNDVIYTAPVNDTNIVSNLVFNEINGHNTIYWRGNTNNQMFFNSYYNNIMLFKNTKNNDLMISVGNDNFVTIKDYFKSGNEAMATSFKLKASNTSFIDLGTVVEERGIADYIVGTDGDDTIRLELGNNMVDGLAGDDFIDGAYDTLNDNNNTTIYGGQGNDRIITGTGNDHVDGGEGNDQITGRRGQNTLIGGAGNDNINGGTDAETILGGDGDDILNSGSGNVNDYIDGGDGKDNINAENGSNSLYGGNGDDTITGGYGTDYIEGGDGDDNLSGRQGNDTIYGGNGDDIISGNEGDDQLIGDSGNDYLIGGAGKDYLYSQSGNNTLNGGTGDDALVGGSDADTFVLDGVAGNDTIYNATSADKIYFDETYHSHSLSKDGNDLIVTRQYHEDDDDPYITSTMRLYNYFTSTDKLDSITYTDDEGNEQTVKISESIIKVTGSGTLTGSLYTDSISGSSGDDVITAGIVQDTNNKDTIVAGAGNDVINIEEGGKAHIDIANYEGNDTINGVALASRIEMSIGSSGTLLYGYQDGDDYLIIRQYKENDEIKQATTTLTNFTLSETTGNIIGIRTSGESYFKPLSQIDLGEDYVPGMQIDAVSGSTFDSSSDNESHYVIGNENDNTIITGSGNDVINTSGGTNHVTTSGGKNSITGGNGIDIIQTGDGDDTINAGGGNNQITISGGSNTVNTGSGDDTINISGSGENHVSVVGGANKITMNTTGNSTITGGTGEDRVVLAGGNTSNNTIYGGAGGDAITATYGNNVIYAGSKSTDGNPYAYTDNERNSITLGVGTNIVYGGSQGDSITSTHVGEQYGTSSIYGGAGADRIDMSSLNSTRIEAGGGDDNITSARNESYIDAGEGKDTINFVGKTATILGGEGDDEITVQDVSDIENRTASITGGAGDDKIETQHSVAETMCFSKGDGHDEISCTTHSGSAEDTLVFSDSHLDKLYASLESYGGTKHLIITYNNGADTVKILNFLNNENDIVSDISKIKTLDDTISISDFVNSRSVVDLVSPDGESGVNYNGIVFAESITGTSYNDTINGGGGNDYILGGAGNDEINDYQGNNTIEGGVGSDTISLYQGNGNTIRFNAGDGFDVVEMNGNDYFDTASTLKFNISSSDLKLEFGKYNDNYGLFIRYGVNPNDKVFLKNFTNREAENIKIATSSGKTTLVDLMAQKHVIGNFTQSDSTLSGSTGNDYLYTGKDYTNTTVTGGKGNDVMTALSDTEGVHYVFNIDASGNGDGNDIIYSVKTSSSYKPSIDFKAVGTYFDNENVRDAFINSLVCRYDDNDLVITYGLDNSKITIKNYESSSSIGKFRIVQNNGTTFDYSFNSYLNIANSMPVHNSKNTMSVDTINTQILMNDVAGWLSDSGLGAVEDTFVTEGRGSELNQIIQGFADSSRNVQIP